MQTPVNFSPASERNKAPILHVLEKHLQATKLVMEIGSGSGQHGEYFAEHLPHLVWQSSERESMLARLQARIDRANFSNLPAAIEFQLGSPSAVEAVQREQAFSSTIDCIFTANTLHIISEALVIDFFREAGELLCDSAQLIVYGPFNYDGKFTSESNRLFDQILRDRGEGSGIRDVEWIRGLAQEQQFDVLDDHAMPANNRTLVFARN